MSVPFEVNFEQTSPVPRGNTIFRGVWRRGFNWDNPQPFIAGYQPPIRPVPARSGTCAPLPKKAAYKIVGVWNETGSGAKDDRVERKKILTLAQAA